MARGWESKSVEEQMDLAQADQPGVRRPLTPQEIEVLRKKETLVLSRARVRQQLESTENPRYLKLLQDTLADLDRKLAEFEPAKDPQQP